MDFGQAHKLTIKLGSKFQSNLIVIHAKYWAYPMSR